MEGIFSDSLKGSLAFIIDINIDEAVAFAHFPCSRRHNINAAPGSVADQIYAVDSDGLVHFFDVLPQVINAIIIMDGTIHFH